MHFKGLIAYKILVRIFILCYSLILHSCFQGMESIQTISLNLSRSKEIRFNSTKVAKMKKLRLLKVHCNDHDGLKIEEYKVFFPKDFEFPHNLRYLHWQGCTLRSLPSKFYGENLIEINLKSSNIKQLWKGNKV